MNRAIVTDQRLLRLKWLMILIPSVTVAVGHLMVSMRPGHRVGGLAEALLWSVLATCVALVPAYIFVGKLFMVLRGLQSEADAREQDILIMNAVMRERERLSRELHDGVAQMVANLLLRLDTIKELASAGRHVEAETELERLHEVADEIYVDIGESIVGIRTNLSERGLIATVQDYLDQFEERHHIPVSLRTDGAADQFSPLAAFQIFRLIQEALTNVRKHAGAGEVTVSLTSAGRDDLRVDISDDGHGFTSDRRKTGAATPFGLTSMRERVEILGGTFDMKSISGSGTCVTATIPIPSTNKEGGHAAHTTPHR